MRRAFWLAIAAHLLLLAAGVRHHLVWGDGGLLGVPVHRLLDGAETLALLGFVALGARACWLASRAIDPALSTRRVLARSLPVVALALLVPPFLSLDVVDYVLRGRVLALHGGNPYVHVASDFPADPLLGLGDSGWKAFPLPYGPIIADLQGGVAWLAHRFAWLGPLGELSVAVSMFKLVFASALVGCAWFARRITAVVRPGRENAAFVAVLWNPLLLAEGVANAHNEPLVVLFVLAAIAGVVERRFAWAFLATGLGVLTKVVPLLIAPLVGAMALRQRRVASLARGGLAVAAVAALAWWQFFRVDGALDFLRLQSTLQACSVLWAIGQAFAAGDGGPLLPIGRGIVALAVLFAALRLLRTGEPLALLRASATVLALFALLGLLLFSPWYHAWWLPIAIVIGAIDDDRGFWPRAAWLATVTGPLAYVVWTGWRRLDAPSQWATFGLALMVPLLGALVWRTGVAQRSGAVA